MGGEDSAAPSHPDTLLETFFGILTHDVVQSLHRLELDDSQSSRRDLVRTMFAATEGYVWKYREFVRGVARDVDAISPMLELALSELTYAVTENGKIEQKVRYISLTAMIRVVTRLAEDISPNLKIDFGSVGWVRLKQAIAIRNRVTHPKNKNDLQISLDDVEISKQGFFWLLHLIADVMEATASASKTFLADLSELAGKLAAGDPDALAEYRAALNDLPD